VMVWAAISWHSLLCLIGTSLPRTSEPLWRTMCI